MVTDKPVPTPGFAEVLVKVGYCGICGSDIHAFDSGFSAPTGCIVISNYPVAKGWLSATG